MTQAGALHCLSLLSADQEGAWRRAFERCGHPITFLKPQAPKVSKALFTLAQARSVKALCGQFGCVHFPPLVAAVDVAPTKDELQCLRRRGVVFVSVGRPNPDLAKEIITALENSANWFKGVGRWGHLPDVMQFVSGDQRAALITVSGPEASVVDTRPWAEQPPPEVEPTSAWYGRVYVQSGTVAHAEAPGGLEGDAAVAKLLSIEDATVRVFEVFLPPPDGAQPTTSIQSSLLNAHYLIDEAARDGNSSIDEAGDTDILDTEVDFSAISVDQLETLQSEEDTRFTPSDNPAGLLSDATPTPGDDEISEMEARARLTQIAARLEAQGLIWATREGQTQGTVGDPGDADLWAAVIAAAQEAADAVAGWFGGVGSQSWGFSADKTGVYCATLPSDDLLVVLDKASKTPAIVQSRVEREAREN